MKECPITNSRLVPESFLVAVPPILSFPACATTDSVSDDGVYFHESEEIRSIAVCLH